MARLRLIRRLWLRFRQIDSRRKVLLAEATLFLIFARLALTFISFPRLSARLGRFMPPDQAKILQADKLATGETMQLAIQISWAVTRSARYLPFRAVCLPQAIAAHAMLKRRGIRSIVHFGVAKGKDDPIEAHAWLDAAGVEVTGFPVAPHFTEIACFA